MNLKLPVNCVTFFLLLSTLIIANQSKSQTGFTPGNLVVLQTSGTASKASSAITLKEFSTNGSAGISVALPTTGSTPIQTSGIFGGSEGFLTNSTDNKYILLGGYGTSLSFTDITATASASVPRVIGTVAPSGFYLEVGSSSAAYSANDIRGAISDGTNYWASGASAANADGIDYYGPGAFAGIGTGATPPKAYGLHIFNGQIYYSTEKSGPNNSSSQLGIFKLGNGLPTTNPVTITQVINTTTSTLEDFSFKSDLTVCYIANNNSSGGGIQKWTNNGSSWTLAYTLGTGVAGTGAYGLVVDYSGVNPVIYATTTDATGSRVITITDTGSGSVASTIVAAQSNVYYKGITFCPVASGTPVVNLSVSTNTASEAAQTQVTVTANSSFAVSGDQTVDLNVSGTGITTGDYTLSNTSITIPDGATSGSVTFTVVDDAIFEGTETATLSISNPSSGIKIGSGASQNITIADNDIANNPPTIALDVANTSDFIDGDSTVSPPSPFTASGVISDPTDPVSTLGIAFTVNDVETNASSLVVTATSSNTTVVPNANVIVSGSGATRNVKITPTGIGYSNITVTVSDGVNNTSYIINYAASAASATPATTLWHTGMSDASDAVALDDNYYVSGDDELDVLNVYSRSASGLPAVSYNYAAYLALPDPTKPETDVEAATRSTSFPNRVYWLGSMSNGKDPFDYKPNRDRLFATTINGTGTAASFSVVGYGAIRTSLIAWGDANGYNFSASAANHVDSKTPSGFAAEGMVFGPDNTTLYIGLRAPLVPTSNRTKAVIAPITNFETWFNNGSPSGDPTYGSPIELDLGQRGIRDLIRLSNGTYIILAGDPGEASTPALYKWTGNAGDAPVLVTSSFPDNLNLEGAMQINQNGNLSLSQLQVISDGGDVILYNDGNEAKDFGQLILRKFRSDSLSNLNLCLATAGDSTAVACGSFTWYDSVYTQSGTPTHTFTNSTGCDSVVTLHLTINHPTTGDTAVVACGGFKWYDSVYTQSGAPTHTFINAAGCDSVVTLHLTINQPTVSSQSVTACSNYSWNDSLYTKSGTYTFTTTNAAGCDSTATLILTINHSTASVTSVTACSNTLPYIWNGVGYRQPGTYTYTTTNAAGCDSIATLQLAIHQSPTIAVVAGSISCFGGTTYLTATGSGGTKPYSYSINNKPAHRANTFNNLRAGVYTVTVIDATGCSASTQYTITQPPALKLKVARARPSCKGASDGIFQATASGGSGGYTYSINNGPYTPNNIFTNLSAGTYTISVKDAHDCITTVSGIMPDGIGRCQAIIGQQFADNSNAQANQFKINVLPNPSITSFLVTVQSKSDANVELTVTDIYGRTVYQQTGSANAQYRFGDHFASGMYIVRVTQGNNMQTLKVIKSE